MKPRLFLWCTGAACAPDVRYGTQTVSRSTATKFYFFFFQPSYGPHQTPSQLTSNPHKHTTHCGGGGSPATTSYECQCRDARDGAIRSMSVALASTDLLSQRVYTASLLPQRTSRRSHRESTGAVRIAAEGWRALLHRAVTRRWHRVCWAVVQAPNKDRNGGASLERRSRVHAHSV